MNKFFDALQKLILKLSGKKPEVTKPNVTIMYPNTMNHENNNMDTVNNMNTLNNTNIENNVDTTPVVESTEEGIYNMPVKEKVSMLDRIKSLIKKDENLDYKDQRIDNSKNLMLIICIVVGVSLMILSISFVLTKNYAAMYMDELTSSKVFNYSYVDTKNGTILEFPSKVKYNRKNIKVKYEILKGQNYLTENNGKFYVNNDEGEVTIKYKATCFGLKCNDERTVTYRIKPMCEELYNTVITYDNFDKVIDRYTTIRVLNNYKDTTVLGNLTITEGTDLLKISIDTEGQYLNPVNEGKATVLYGLTYKLCSDTVEKNYDIKYTRYSVKFNSDGGSDINTQDVIIGNNVIIPANPFKQGYVFEGWTLDNQPYSFTIPPTKNITLKATWSKGLELVIDINGGDMPSSLSEISYQKAGTKITLPTPTCKGYKFVRWSVTSGTLSGNVYTMPEQDATIKALWTK